MSRIYVVGIAAHRLPECAAMRTSIPYLSAVLVGCLLAAGCATEPDDLDGLDDTSTTQDALTNNQKVAFDFFVAKGLTKRQSAGIVGNLIQESSVNPKAIEFGGGPGRGIAQWSTGGRWNTSHDDNVTWYANKHNRSRWALGTQLDFVWYELASVGGYGLGPIRKATTIAAATIAFENDFEKCGQCDQARRIAYARQVFHDFASSAVVAAGEDDVVDAEADSSGLDEQP